jgi:hypothetical protein
MECGGKAAAFECAPDPKAGALAASFESGGLAAALHIRGDTEC